MPGFAKLYPRPEAPPLTDTTSTIGWKVDIASIQDGSEKLIYYDCALSILVNASQLFEDLAHEHCSRPLAYGEETRIKYLLPRGVAAAAFIRILEWIRAIADISAHGDIEDPQITTFEDDGLVQYVRLLQAASLLKLKYPYHNQKRLPDMIKANIKKAFDTKNNSFQNITITDREIGLIWDAGRGDRNDSIIKLLLALFVDAYDIRRETSHKFKDNILARFDSLVEKNADFRSAVIDVKTKKGVRLREEERERKGLPKGATAQRCGRGERRRRSKNWSSNDARKDSQKVANHEDVEQWRSQELNQSQVEALMHRPEEFRIAYGSESELGNQYYR